MVDLTARERESLTAHEQTIERRLGDFVEVGTALLAIRDGRLYRQEYPTFEAYCLARWSITHRHGNRLIEAAQVVANVGPIGPMPASESQARVLAPLPPDRQREVWREASEDGGTITAARLRELVDRSGVGAVPTPAPRREDVAASERAIRDQAAARDRAELLEALRRTLTKAARQAAALELSPVARAIERALVLLESA